MSDLLDTITIESCQLTDSEPDTAARFVPPRWASGDVGVVSCCIDNESEISLSAADL